MLQTNVNMCKTGLNSLTFTTIEQTIAWEYIEAYQRLSDFPILSIFQLLKFLKN